MRTALGLHETPVYGIVWGHHDLPLTTYSDLDEARSIARLLRGSVVMRRLCDADWVPV